MSSDHTTFHDGPSMTITSPASSSSASSSSAIANLQQQEQTSSSAHQEIRHANAPAVVPNAMFSFQKKKAKKAPQYIVKLTGTEHLRPSIKASPNIKVIESQKSDAEQYLKQMGGSHSQSVAVALELLDEKHEAQDIKVKIWNPDTTNLSAVNLGAVTLTMTGVEQRSLDAFRELYRPPQAMQNPRVPPTARKVWTDRPIIAANIPAWNGGKPIFVRAHEMRSSMQPLSDNEFDLIKDIVENMEAEHFSIEVTISPILRNGRSLSGEHWLEEDLCKVVVDADADGTVRQIHVKNEAGTIDHLFSRPFEPKFMSAMHLMKTYINADKDNLYHENEYFTWQAMLTAANSSDQIGNPNASGAVNNLLQAPVVCPSHMTDSESAHMRKTLIEATRQMIYFLTGTPMTDVRVIALGKGEAQKKPYRDALTQLAKDMNKCSAICLEYGEDDKTRQPRVVSALRIVIDDKRSYWKLFGIKACEDGGDSKIFIQDADDNHVEEGSHETAIEKSALALLKFVASGNVRRNRDLKKNDGRPDLTFTMPRKGWVLPAVYQGHGATIEDRGYTLSHLLPKENPNIAKLIASMTPWPVEMVSAQGEETMSPEERHEKNSVTFDQFFDAKSHFTKVIGATDTPVITARSASSPLPELEDILSSTDAGKMQSGDVNKELAIQETALLNEFATFEKERTSAYDRMPTAAGVKALLELRRRIAYMFGLVKRCEQLATALRERRNVDMKQKVAALNLLKRLDLFRQYIHAQQAAIDHTLGIRYGDIYFHNTSLTEDTRANMSREMSVHFMSFFSSAAEWVLAHANLPAPDQQLANAYPALINTYWTVLPKVVDALAYLTYAATNANQSGGDPDLILGDDLDPAAIVAINQKLLDEKFFIDSDSDSASQKNLDSPAYLW
jgi:hypothetical protein